MNSNLKNISITLLFILSLTLFCFSCATHIPVRNVHTDPQTTTTITNSESTPSPSPIPVTDPERAQKEAAYEFGPMSEKEFQKYAYELGFDPKNDLSLSQKIQIDQRKKLRQLERRLDSQKERLQYSKILPWMHSDEEKIEFLSIPSIEGRQAWINKSRIWLRAKELKDYSDVMDSEDIAMGMPADYVKRSWGDPDAIEVSGNSIYKNERWKYLKQVSTPQGYHQEKRHIYFEGGRVVGWETE